METSPFVALQSNCALLRDGEIFVVHVRDSKLNEIFLLGEIVSLEERIDVENTWGVNVFDTDSINTRWLDKFCSLEKHDFMVRNTFYCSIYSPSNSIHLFR